MVQEPLYFGHLFRIAARMQILKRRGDLFGLFSVGGGSIGEVLTLILVPEKGLSQDLLDVWSFMRSNPQNNLDEVDVLVF